MRTAREAFHEFWSGFYNRSFFLPEAILIPAYQSGYASSSDARGKPKEPTFPYITYDIVCPGFLEGTFVTASIWDKDPKIPGRFGLVDDVLLQISEKIPSKGARLSEGAVLDCGSAGKMRLMRSNPFMSYLTDPDDHFITRGIVSMIARSYVP